MSWIVEWNGKEYDVDPLTFSGLELSILKQRTGFKVRDLIAEAIPDLDGDAIRGLFWIVDRRENPDLKFTEYDGPPLALLLSNMGGFIESANALAESMGKAIRTTRTTGTNGGPGSPSSIQPMETEASTTG